VFAGKPVDTTEENLQSRTRGAFLMALSNKFGGLLLTTGNKSEYAVGYATIYGDMCGGYAPIKDLYKTEVFALARWRNTVGDRVVPEAVIERPPSAELRRTRRTRTRCRPTTCSTRSCCVTSTRSSRARRSWKRHQAAPGPKGRASMPPPGRQGAEAGTHRRMEAAPGRAGPEGEPARVRPRERRYPITVADSPAGPRASFVVRMLCGYVLQQVGGAPVGRRDRRRSRRR
jgi:hypothetical protein